MTDWRQIQARIRKARASSAPVEQLSELYQRTNDAMVAFELARLQEKAGENADAAKWYTAAAKSFRRAQWRVKAEEALARLGAPVPVAAAPSGALQSSESSSATDPSFVHASDAPSVSPEAIAEEFAEEVQASEEVGPFEHQPPPTFVERNFEGEPQPGLDIPSSSPQGQPGKKRRRGRRGGRNRRRGRGGREGAEPGTAQNRGAQGAAAGSRQPARHFSSSPGHVPAAPEQAYRPAAAPAETSAEPSPRSFEARQPASDFESPRSIPSGPLGSRSRAGEPALASRIAQLESRLRRLLACPMASLDDAEHAPAGPGVLLLSDSDQVTHYYIEDCQTLRIAIGNLLRGARGGKALSELKPRMAENLGIAESRVAKYMKDHCAVRWLQLDEDASQLAHFAISVLRPVVNE